MDWPGEIDVLILGAVRQEIDALTRLLETCHMRTSRGQTSWFGKYSNLSVLLGTTGLGKVNAAITAACLLERYAVGQVWQIGCAGAYPEGPLRIGDVLITEKALCGDEGVMTKGGVLSGAQIGIPILLHHGEEVFDHVPLQWNEALRSIIQKTPPGLYRQTRGPALAAAHPCDVEDSSFHLVHGPSLTVGMVSGDPEVACERFQRYGAYAENMEGSAVAHACWRFQLPMAECRGISNWAGIRAKDTWRLEKSIAHCHGIIINWLDALNSAKSQQ